MKMLTAPLNATFLGCRFLWNFPAFNGSKPFAKNEGLLLQSWGSLRKDYGTSHSQKNFTVNATSQNLSAMGLQGFVKYFGSKLPALIIW